MHDDDAYFDLTLLSIHARRGPTREQQLYLDQARHRAASHVDREADGLAEFCVAVAERGAPGQDLADLRATVARLRRLALRIRACPDAEVAGVWCLPETDHTLARIEAAPAPG